MASLDDRSTFNCEMVLEEDSNFVPISLDDDGRMMGDEKFTRNSGDFKANTRHVRLPSRWTNGYCLDWEIPSDTRMEHGAQFVEVKEAARARTYDVSSSFLYRRTRWSSFFTCSHFPTVLLCYKIQRPKLYSIYLASKI